MASMRIAALASLLLLLAIVTPAQAEDMKKIAVDLTNQSVAAGVPFDEPFIITGTVAPAVQRLELTLFEATEAVCREAKKGKQPQPRMSFCDSAAPTGDVVASTQEWRRRVGGTDNFQFTLPPLKAYHCYSLAFTQYLQPATDAERTKLQNALAAELRDRLATVPDSELEEGQADTLAEDLRKVADTFVQTQFKACLPKDAIKLKEGPQLAALTVLRTARGDKTKQTDVNLPNTRSSLVAGFCFSACNVDSRNPKPCGGSNNECTAQDTDWKQLLDNLNAILAKPDLLTAGPKKWWDQPLNPAREATKTVTLANATAAVADGLNRCLLANIISGDAKIVGPVVQTTTTPDLPSLELLQDFFTILSSPAFRMTSNGTEIPVLPPSLAGCLISINSGFGGLTTALRKLAEAEATLKNPQFPDVLADQLLSQEFVSQTSPTLITQDANPYISLDAGIAYGFRLDKAFPYYGANFYFVPVNKRAPLSRFHGRERFLKSFSLLLGLSNGSFEDDRSKKYFSAGSILAGAGWRFNQFVKLNGGALLFKQLDANPVVNVQRKKVVPFASVSIDIDLKGLLGNVGTIFQ